MKPLSRFWATGRARLQGCRQPGPGEIARAEVPHALCGILAAGEQAVIPKPCFGAIPGRLGALSRLQGLPEGCDRMNPVLIRGLAPPRAPRATRGAARSIPWCHDCHPSRSQLGERDPSLGPSGPPSGSRRWHGLGSIATTPGPSQPMPSPMGRRLGPGRAFLWAPDREVIRSKKTSGEGADGAFTGLGCRVSEPGNLDATTLRAHDIGRVQKVLSPEI